MAVIVDRADRLTATSDAPQRRRATRPPGPPDHDGGNDSATPTPTPAGRPAATRRRRWRLPRRPRIVLTNIRLRRVVALLAVVAVAGAGFVAVTEQLEHRRHDRATADRAAIVEAAKRGVTYLINIRHDDADADFNRLADISTAPFSDELHSQSANYLQAIRDADVLSTGEVLDAALSVDDGNGTSDPAAVSVIVAANAQVTNTQTHQQEQRSYRFDVEIKRVNGIPKVSSLEFVP